jgi:NADH dehydrogenase
VSIRTRTFICTVGNAANPIVKHTLRVGHFVEAQLNGRGIGSFATDRTLQCVGKDGYWAVGDCAGVPTEDGKGLCPPTAQFAIREAKTCARNILATIDKKEKVAFKFKALGMLASLGGHGAVAEMMGIRFSGFLAWFAWRTVYLLKLPGWARRVRVALDWTLDLFFARDITQMQTARSENLQICHYEPGELIIHEGHIGRELYMIESGEVEVLSKSQAGTPPAVIATLGAREVFGERALLEDTKRSASVRAKSQVDVLVMSRSDFRAMVGQFPVLKDHFTRLLEERYPKEMAGQDLATVGDDTAETWRF